MTCQVWTESLPASPTTSCPGSSIPWRASGAQYVKQRNSSTFYPATSNTYSVSSGQRVILVLISDSGSSMLDLSTVRIAMRIKNNDANPMVFTGRHLACMFSRVTTRVKGVQVDDVLFYNLSLIHI